jgi:hypothetical protein
VYIYKYCYLFITLEYRCINFEVLMVPSVRIGIPGHDDVWFCIPVQFGTQILNYVAGCVKCIFSLVIFVAVCPRCLRLLSGLILVYCCGCVKQNM